MKITRIKQYLVPPRWCFIKIETDEGLVGWGEPVIEGKAQTVSCAVEELADMLLGQNPLHIERLWQTMYRGNFYRGGAVLMSAIAGVDQALWDIKGKYYGAPVHALLGGPVRDKVRMYTWIGIAMLTVPIFVPIITRLGYDPVWFGILFSVNMQISFLSPPFGPGVFYLHSVAPKGISLLDIFRAVVPYIIMQALLLLAYSVSQHRAATPLAHAALKKGENLPLSLYCQ